MPTLYERLMDAIDDQDVPLVRQLIASGVDINYIDEDQNGKTPLFEAVARENPEIPRILISSGANVNARDHSGYYPIHMAISFNRLENVITLIAAGANVNVRNNYNITPISLARAFRNPDMMRTLVEAIQPPQPRPPPQPPVKASVFYDYNDDCKICLDNLNNGAPVCKVVPCSHVFHCGCINRVTNGKCPTCRGAIRAIKSADDDIRAVDVSKYREVAGLQLFGRRKTNFGKRVKRKHRVLRYAKQGPIKYRMSGDDDIGSYADAAGITFFGKRRKRTVKKVPKELKVPSKIKKLCKRLKIKMTIKRGKKRVKKTLKQLKKEIKRKLKRVKRKGV